ncbi:MAG: hypothetical protein HY347_11660 [candidate division NC10 bacterium]|nr:hypothetical protein [candidate division NC10 bacterium]
MIKEGRPNGALQEKQQKRGQWKKWVRLIGGWGLILGGLVGLFLPFLQGIALIVAGLALLSRDAPWARRCMERIKAWARKLKG